MLWSVIFIICGVYFGFGLLLVLMQSKFVYFPRREIIRTPADAGLQYEDITLKTPDGVNISAWFIPSDSAKFTVVFCHGNGGNISYWLEAAEILHGLNLSVMLFDYRGYGKSGGTPSEKGTYLDSETVYTFLLKEKNIPENKIIIHGRSLGSCIAANLAKKHSPKACILESAFTSIPDMASNKYPFYPSRFLVRFRYSTIQYVKDVKCPVLIAHSPEDEIVPFSHGGKIYEAANWPKTFLEVHGSHNECFFDSADKYTRGLEDFINTLE